MTYVTANILTHEWKDALMSDWANPECSRSCAVSHAELHSYEPNHNASRAFFKRYEPRDGRREQPGQPESHEPVDVNMTYVSGQVSADGGGSDKQTRCRLASQHERRRDNQDGLLHALPVYRVPDWTRRGAPARPEHGTRVTTA